MLSSEISAALVDGKSANAIASAFGKALMSAPKLLKAELQGDGPLSRKRFCEFLGIGESTLTGWLQTERIPQAAAVAYALLLATRALQARVNRLECSREEPRIIAIGDKYAVVRFESGKDERSIGRVIAGDIGDLITARQFAFSQSGDLPRLVERQLEFVEQQIDTTQQAGNDTPFRMSELESERVELKRLMLLMSDDNQSVEDNNSDTPS